MFTYKYIFTSSNFIYWLDTEERLSYTAWYLSPPDVVMVCLWCVILQFRIVNNYISRILLNNKLASVAVYLNFCHLFLATN